MAVKFIEHRDNGLLGFWEITETTEELLALVNPQNEELENFLQLKNELRKREWLAVRLLMQKMLESESKISYDPTGKPFLAHSSGHISISHSSNRVVLYFHPEHQPGIDIELITRNVERTAKRFLSPGELNDCTIDGQLSNRDLMLRWCAKEAVFKMVPFNDIDFANQIECSAPRLIMNEGVFSATFTSSATSLHIPLHFRLVGDLLVVWGHLKI